MKTEFQVVREKNTNITCAFDRPHNINVHFHSQIEILVICKGNYSVNVNEEISNADNGTICIADSYNSHGFTCLDNEADDTRSCVLIIPQAYLQLYNRFKGNLVLSKNIIHNKELADELYALCRCILPLRKEDNLLTHGYINTFMGKIVENSPFVEQKFSEDVNLLRKILMYIDNNFLDKITLSGLSKELGYSSAHISRTFHSFFNCGITIYINQLRAKYVKHIMKSDNPPKLYAAIFEAGFSSIQTYYRTIKNMNENIFKARDVK